MRKFWLLPILLGTILVLGVAVTAEAEAPDYVILTAFTDEGDPTWFPPVVVVDMDTLGHPKTVTLKVDNVSAEDFGFRIDGLDIIATIPVREDRLITIPTNQPGIYRMYSDLHTQTRATTDLIQRTRPNVSGWLVIGSKRQGDRFYLDMAKYFGRSLEDALTQLQRHELDPRNFTAFANECEIQLDMLRWTTNALHDPGIAAPEDRALAYGELHAIVNDELRPGFHKMVRQMNLKQVSRHASLARAIKKLKEIQHVVDSVPGRSTR